MIVTVVENTYVALSKGHINPGHVLIVPVHHHISSRSIEALNDGGALFRHCETEIQDIVTKYQGYQMENGNYLVRFEVFGGGDPSQQNVRLHHMHVNLVPIPADSVEKIHEGLKNRAVEAGLEISNQLPANTFWPFFRIKVHDKEELIISPPKQKADNALVPFDINLVRSVVCELIGLPDREVWKQCVVSFQEEETITEDLRKIFIS